MYDFDFSAAGVMESVCNYDDKTHNPNPIVGCQFYQAGVAFSAVGWSLLPAVLSDKQVSLDNFHDLDNFPNPQTSAKSPDGKIQHPHE
jgi:hypothetical protein